MNFETFKTLVSRGNLSTIINATRMVAPFYRVAFYSAAGSAGLLELLRHEPASFDAIARRMGADPQDALMLEAWLDVGITLGELSLTDGKYALASSMAQQLAQEKNDPVLASLQEVVLLHFEAIVRVPEMLREGRRFTKDDYRSEEVVRASRLVEPFNHEAISMVVPTRGRMRYLDMGCGLGRNLRHAALRNPELVGIGLEVDPEVVPLATANLAEWGLDDRFEIVHGDVREMNFTKPFDIVCSNSNIYYFAPETRVTLMERLHTMVAPGGKLLMTSACRGGSPGLELINTWFCAADFGGPLPTATEVPQMMLAAGFDDVVTKRLFPGESVFAWIGTRSY